MSDHKNAKLLIKEFIYEGKFYLYDTYTNTLLQITKEHYLVIERFKRNGFPFLSGLTDLPAPDRDIMMLKNRGMFASGIVKEVSNPYLPYVESMLQGSLNDMTLQITQKCNFDCRYCLYAGDEGIERTHKNENMSFDMARASIDFLYDHSHDAEKIYISFYGGEPLLNFDLIREIVAYIKTKFFSKVVDYAMTINGSLLSEDVINFFVENNFKLSISLDGPESVQDKHRRFRDSGRGTFKAVISNVFYLKENYPEYFHKNVFFCQLL